MLSQDEDPWANGEIPLDDQDREFLSHILRQSEQKREELRQAEEQIAELSQHLQHLQKVQQQFVGRVAELKELSDAYLRGFDAKYGTGGAMFEIDRDNWVLKRLEE